MKEHKVDNYPEFVNINGTNKNLVQIKNTICKIYKGSRTAFFCFISFKKEKLKVLINNHHVINEKFLNEKNIIKFGINNDVILKNIKLKNDRKINLNKDNDLAIIALKDKDNLNEIN